MNAIVSSCPPELRQALAATARRFPESWLVGGVVRDFLLGRADADIDLAVSGSAQAFAEELRRRLNAGVFVRLGDGAEDAIRLVWHGFEIDIASLRGGAATIEADLCLRDYTINAMAMPLVAALSGQSIVIDPLNGEADLRQRRLRMCRHAFVADPLRMLRGYRFAAQLAMTMDAATQEEIRRQAALIDQVAAERICHEFDLLMDCPGGGDCFAAMWDDGLLPRILPELAAGDGLRQPDFHHLDVLRHNLLALTQLEQILAGRPPLMAGAVAMVAENRRRARLLKYAALLHDVGKPPSRGIKGDRVTFYGHDTAGAELFAQIAARLRWSAQDARRVSALIAMHMRPFHLCNAARAGKLTLRALLRLCRDLDADQPGGLLPELFLLAMADSLASHGRLKPENMEGEVAALYERATRVYEERFRPIQAAPRLVTGRDLIERFGLAPGPIFAALLRLVEDARLQGQIENRDQALALIAARLAAETYPAGE
ncbi:MAG: HD domain-containing protein [Desulfobulbaceae bacterium]|jgi:poly(A) polymerase|nr:HD domain-containing protein [Desulfobulbaceae bacterium]